MKNCVRKRVKMTKFILTAVMFCLIANVQVVNGQFWKKKSVKSEVKAKKKISDYKKLFKDKKVETKKGLVTLHKIEKEGKLYFEFPLNLLNRDMLLASTVSKISDNGNCTVGTKPHWPLHIKWAKKGNMLNINLVNTDYVKTGDEGINKALENNFTDAVFKGFKILAYNEDSTSVVVDVTKFFAGNIRQLDPFDMYSSNTYMGMSSRATTFKQSESSISEVKAFEDNICIYSDLSYDVTLKVFGVFMQQDRKPTTAKVARTMILLPEKPMMPRLNDPRVNIFYSYGIDFSLKKKHGAKLKIYANRWKLEPKDEIVWKSGKLVEPKKPIVFYVDNCYPESWKKYVRLGVEDWQLAFEKIGFKNAIIAKDFPTKEEDPEFDPDNFKYSCLRYQPTPVANSMGPSWVDPRSGEILNASVYSFHDVGRLVRNWKFIQTAQVNEKVRTKKLSEEEFGKALRYIIAHEIGHCLGFMHNMCSSAAVPTEKLRDPEFTNKYGTTFSIMDYARWNYVAQPGDKGVRLSPPRIGLYDYYSVKWLYTPILSANTPDEEVPTLNKWIEEKDGDLRFRYGKQQIGSGLDPSSQTEDLGDDHIKASNYGIKNLKYIMKNLNNWVGHEDKTRDFRAELYVGIMGQYANYVSHVLLNIGGVYVNQSYDGDKLPAYDIVPKKKVIESINFVYDQIEDLDWLQNEKLLKKLEVQRAKESYAEMAKRLMMALMARVNMVDRQKVGGNTDVLSEREYMTMNHNFIFKRFIKSKKLTKKQRLVLDQYFSQMFEKSGIGPQKDKKSRRGLNIDEMNLLTQNIKEKYDRFYGFDKIEKHYHPEQQQGFGFRVFVDMPKLDLSDLFYEFVLKAKKEFIRLKKSCHKDDFYYYDLKIRKIEKALK